MCAGMSALLVVVSSAFPFKHNDPFSSQPIRICRADRQSDYREGCPYIHIKLKWLGFGKVAFVEGQLVGGQLALRIPSLSDLCSPQTLWHAAEEENNTRRAAAAGWSGGTATAKGGGHILGKLQVTIPGISTAAKHQRRSQTMRLRKMCKKDIFFLPGVMCFLCDC